MEIGDWSQDLSLMGRLQAGQCRATEFEGPLRTVIDSGRGVGPIDPDHRVVGEEGACPVIAVVNGNRPGEERIHDLLGDVPRHCLLALADTLVRQDAAAGVEQR